MPIAVGLVEREPLAEGDFYPGDLVDALMRRVPESYWQAHEDQLGRLRDVARSLDPAEADEDVLAVAAAFLRR